MLDTFPAVEAALGRYLDPVQPRVAGKVDAPRHGTGDRSRFPFPGSLLGRLDERQELRRRLQWLTPDEQVVVFRWYVESAPPERIARALGRSVRHVYRLRTRAIEAIVELGREGEFADADVAEFAPA